MTNLPSTIPPDHINTILQCNRAVNLNRRAMMEAKVVSLKNWKDNREQKTALERLAKDHHLILA